MFGPLPCTDPLKEPRILGWQRDPQSSCPAWSVVPGDMKMEMEATRLLEEDVGQEPCSVPQGRDGVVLAVVDAVTLGNPVLGPHARHA